MNCSKQLGDNHSSILQTCISVFSVCACAFRLVGGGNAETVFLVIFLRGRKKGPGIICSRMREIPRKSWELGYAWIFSVYVAESDVADAAAYSL